jgi:hypothetical protein
MAVSSNKFIYYMLFEKQNPAFSIFSIEN